jgi:DNA-binding response OmpR family regulator
MKKILVIEDDTTIANLYRSRLQAQNYDVEYAPDGQTGYYAIYDVKPDVVLIDLTLPQMDAVSIVGKIRAQKKFQKLPMFALVDSLMASNAEEAITAGVTHLFNKEDPNTLNEIVAALGDLFNPFLKGNRLSGAVNGKAAEPPQASGVAEPAPRPAREIAPPPAKLTDEPLNFSLSSLSEELAKLEGVETEVNEHAELHDTFIQEYGSLIHPIRKAFLNFSTSKALEEKQASAEELVKRTTQLKISAMQCEMEGLGLLCAPLEALMKSIASNLDRATAGTCQTIANAIDVLAALHNRTEQIRELNNLRPTALVVDDENVSRKALGIALQKGRIQTSAAENPENALKEAEEKLFDLIFLDVEMPGMNGFALCARIRMLPNHKSSTIIFVSAFSDLKTRASSKISGGNHFITKPVNANELNVTAWTFLVRNRLAL